MSKLGNPSLFTIIWNCLNPFLSLSLSILAEFVGLKWLGLAFFCFSQPSLISFFPSSTFPYPVRSPFTFSSPFSVFSQWLYGFCKYPWYSQNSLRILKEEADHLHFRHVLPNSIISTASLICCLNQILLTKLEILVSKSIICIFIK